MITLNLYPTYVYASFTLTNEEKHLRDALTFKLPDAEKVRQVNMSIAKKKKDWRSYNYYYYQYDGTKCFFEGNTFPFGFLRAVKMYFYREAVDFKVIDNRPDIVQLDHDLIFNGELKEFQMKALLDNIHEERGIFKIGTGGGKTVLGLMLVAVKNVRTTILVPTDIIKKQWEEAIEQFIPNATYLNYKRKFDYDFDYDIMVITFSSFKSAAKLKAVKDKTIRRQQRIIQHYKDSYMAIIDEVHNFASDKSTHAFNLNNILRYIYGLSATVGKRSDEADMNYYALTGGVIADISQLELVELGQTVPLHVKFEEIPSMAFSGADEWQAQDKDFDVEWQYIVINRERNNKIIKLALERAFYQNKQTLIIFTRTDHGNGLFQILQRYTDRADFKSLGYSSESVVLLDGSVTGKARERVVKLFNNRTARIMLAQVRVIQEGFNSAGIRSIIIAKGGKSEIQTIQSVGRGVRLDEEKEFVEIIDFADQGKYVRNHSEERFFSYLKISKNVDVSHTYLENINFQDIFTDD